MHAPLVVQASTPMSTTSSTTANNPSNVSTTVQSGPYTKAQFQNTMEGSRSVKNIKEVEQLLRDYPAALELYRTGRYKVKIKNEADVERVILVEKRATKMVSNVLKANENQPPHSSIPDVSNSNDRKRDESKDDQSRIRTHSHDRSAPVTSTSESNPLVQTTGSSIRLPSNAQPKVDNHRTSSKERDVSVISQPKQQQSQDQQQQQQQSQQETHHRSNSRDSRSKTSHSKSKGRRNTRDYQNAVVPYVPNGNPAANMWQASRVPQPYYSNPLISHQSLMPNMYTPLPYGSPQYPGYQQPYYYGPQPYPALAYQKPANYPTTQTVKSTTAMTHTTVPGLHNYPAPPQSGYNSNQAVPYPQTFQTYHTNQQQYPYPQAIYQPQLPFQMSTAWPTTDRHTGPPANHTDDRQAAKHRARSLDPGPRVPPPIRFTNLPPMPSQQQPQVVVAESHHHHHRSHHLRPHPANIQVANTNPPVEPGKGQNVPPKDPTVAAPVAPIRGAPAEKLTIRQLNEIFLRTDPSGRLPYNALPNILQRFGIVLTENDLASSAQRLEYTPNEPLSARRLVHILVDLGKIAKSTQQQQQQQQPRPAASPAILPEDREVNDIMTQRRVVGAQSTHVHSSIYPNHWY